MDDEEDPAKAGSKTVTMTTNAMKTNTQTAYTYDDTDTGPYRVLVELLDTKEDSISINKLSFGKILTKVKEYKQNVINVKPLGKKKLMVHIKTAQAANQMQADQSLRQQNYNVYIPKHFLTVSGVISGVPLEMTVEEIKESISSTVPVLDVTRLHRYENGNKIPVTRVGVTFRSHQLPREVRMFCCTNRVQPFASKAVFCQKCLRYNHRTQNCRSRQRCEKCSLSHEEEGYGNCQKPVKCLHCKTEGKHQTGDYACPERTRQNNLKLIMAKTNLTMIEAREVYPVYTENQYSVLENIEEYPKLPESYAEVIYNKPKSKPQVRGVRFQGNTKRPSDEVNVGDVVQIFNDPKKRKNQESEETGTALFNRYRTSEAEKQRWKMAQTKKGVQATEDMQIAGWQQDSDERQQVSQSVVTNTFLRVNYDRAKNQNKINQILND